MYKDQRKKKAKSLLMSSEKEAHMADQYGACKQSAC